MYSLTVRLVQTEGRGGEAALLISGQRGLSLKSASVRWAGWATVTYGRVGKLKNQGGQTKKKISALGSEFCPPWPETLPAPLVLSLYLSQESSEFNEI